MLIIGCNYQPSVQQIAWVDEESGECGERLSVTFTPDNPALYSPVTKAIQIQVSYSNGFVQW